MCLKRTKLYRKCHEKQGFVKHRKSFKLNLFKVYQMLINQEVVYLLTDSLSLTLMQCVSSLPWMHLMSSLICEWKEHNEPSAVCKDLKNL